MAVKWWLLCSVVIVGQKMFHKIARSPGNLELIRLWNGERALMLFH